MISVATANVAAGRASSDRVLVVQEGSSVVIALADGAGGTTFGTNAADLFVETVRHELGHGLDDPHLFQELLITLDSRLAREGGETTAILASVSRKGVIGAGVGDSEAWLFNGTSAELTRDQPRKPLLGSGRAKPTTFAHGPWNGTLIIGSDGLFGYARSVSIEAACAQPLDDAAKLLIGAVSLPNGKLQDDVSFVLVRL